VHFLPCIFLGSCHLKHIVAYLNTDLFLSLCLQKHLVIKRILYRQLGCVVKKTD